MHLSIVTGTYNRYTRLIRFLDSCREQLPKGIEYEFVITGVAGDEPTLTYLQQQPDVKLIIHEGLLGAVKAFTDACELATGKYVLIANDDVEILPGSILRAMAHLEDNPRVGGVAFADNRLNKDVFRAAYVPGIRNGVSVSVPYIQIGMVRNWLGSFVGWWSLHGTFPARTYAADNAMSAAILETGYDIVEVAGCQAIDHMEHDALRDLNATVPDGGEHPDSAAYYARWPHGPHIPNAPTVEAPKPNAREIGMRILYLPIYEGANPDHAEHWKRRTNQLAQKRGLRDALMRLGMVYELDYLRYQYRTEQLWQDLARILNTFQPDILFTQVHATDVLTVEIIRNIRAHCPRLVIVNWNGDYWPEAQLNPKMMEWLRYVDMVLVVNDDVRKTYEELGYPAAYWQASYEHTPAEPPAVQAHDVVFLGQNYHQERRILGNHLNELKAEGYDVQIYGSGWLEGEAGADCTYDFLTIEALYKNAKISIGNNHFPENYGFVSDRIFHALAGGGALLLHQHVKGLEKLTGITPGVHFVEWKTYDEMKQWVRYFLDPAHEDERRKIAEAGTRFVTYAHSFDARLKELFNVHLPKAKTKLRRVVAVHYMGRRSTPFGVKGAHTGEQYQCVPGVPMVIDTLDMKALLEIEAGLWEEVSRPLEGVG